MQFVVLRGVQEELILIQELILDKPQLIYPANILLLSVSSALTVVRYNPGAQVFVPVQV